MVQWFHRINVTDRFDLNFDEYSTNFDPERCRTIYNELFILCYTTRICDTIETRVLTRLNQQYNLWMKKILDIISFGSIVNAFLFISLTKRSAYKTNVVEVRRTIHQIADCRIDLLRLFDGITVWPKRRKKFFQLFENWQDIWF